MDELFKLISTGGDLSTIALVFWMLKLDRRILAIEFLCRKVLKNGS
ncbi:MAG: hypothetical protein QM500_04185 [Methylococcales bacterium]